MSSAIKKERALFDQCITLAPEQWDSVLQDACPDDADLRERVRRMLEKSAASTAYDGGFLKLRADDPEHIGPYRILQRLGEGGMGIVYAAEQREPLRRRVAIKVLRSGYSSREVLARFEMERQALALMTHENIARILDAGTTPDRRPYIVMEFVPGEAITRYCERLDLPLRQRLSLFCQVCEAVQHAHQKGVIHRDLKPSNILVMETANGPVPKVIDFGVAKALAGKLTEHTLETKVGSLLGTPDYMSPEQADLSPLDIDTRADVYALGAVLYRLLAGKPPLELPAGNYSELQKAIHTQEPLAPSRRAASGAAEEIRGELDWIVLKALEKERNRRYSSAAELGMDVRRHLDGEIPLAGPHTWRYRSAKFARKHVLGVGIVAAAFLALAAFAALMSWQVYQTAYERNRANAEAETSARVTTFMLELFRAVDPEDAESANVSARDLLQRALAKLREDDSLPPDVRLRMLAGLADAYRSIVQPTEAIPLYREALRLAGPDSDPVLRVQLLLALGTALNSELERTEAQGVLQQAMAIAQTASIDDPELLFDLRHAIARSETNAERALAMQEALFEDVTAHFGSTHRLTFRSGIWLVRAYLSNAQFDVAERLANTLLPRAREVLGDEHSVVANLLGSLGIIYIYREEWTEAERFNRQARDMLVRRLGANSVSTLYSEVRLALSLADRNAGLTSLHDLMRRYGERYGQNSPQMIELMQNIGWLHLQIPGNEAQALAALERAQLLAEVHLGPDNDITANGYYELAVVQARLGRHARAFQYLHVIADRPQLQFRAAREPAFDVWRENADFLALLGRFAPQPSSSDE